jgi:hypothetical protein
MSIIFNITAIDGEQCGNSGERVRVRNLKHWEGNCNPPDSTDIRRLLGR